LVYGKRLAYDIGWARLDAFCLVPLSLRLAWRRRVAPNLNQKVENATLKNECGLEELKALKALLKFQVLEELRAIFKFQMDALLANFEIWGGKGF